MKSLSLILMVLCGTLFASSQTVELPETSGNAFMRLCSAIDKEDPNKLEMMRGASCAAYVSGFMNGAEFGAAFVEDHEGKKVRHPFCRPLEVENGQLVRVVLKFIRDNPERAHQSTSWLLMDAFGKAYPCK